MAPEYIHFLVRRKFSPSRSRADKIAKFFGDEPHLVRVLAGLETAPAAADRTLAAIQDVAARLDPAGRLEALRYLKYLLADQNK